MSRVLSIDTAAKSVTWLCSACGAEHTVPVRVGRAGGDGAFIALDMPCGATVHVPYNDWSSPELTPDVGAELANHVYYLRGDKSGQPGVTIVVLDKTLGPPDPGTGLRPVVERDGEPGVGLVGGMVPPEAQALVKALAKRDKSGRMVGLDGEVV